MKSIIETHSSLNNVLFVYSDGSLDIVGDNTSQKTGEDYYVIHLTRAKPLDFKLCEDERISVFQAFLHDMIILTTHGRLVQFCSRNVAKYDALATPDQTKNPSYTPETTNASHLEEEPKVSNPGIVYFLKLQPDKENDELAIKNATDAEIKLTTTTPYHYDTINSVNKAITYSSPWTPLANAAFKALSLEEKKDYISKAKEAVPREMNSYTPPVWTTKDELVDDVFSQIDKWDETLASCEIQNASNDMCIGFRSTRRVIVTENVTGITFHKNGYMYNVCDPERGTHSVVQMINGPDDIPPSVTPLAIPFPLDDHNSNLNSRVIKMPDRGVEPVCMRRMMCYMYDGKYHVLSPGFYTKETVSYFEFPVEFIQSCMYPNLKSQSQSQPQDETKPSDDPENLPDAPQGLTDREAPPAAEKSEVIPVSPAVVLSRIHWCAREATLYYEADDNYIYRFHRETGKFVKFLHRNSSYSFAYALGGDEICVLEQNAIHCGGAMIKFRTITPPMIPYLETRVGIYILPGVENPSHHLACFKKSVIVVVYSMPPEQQIMERVCYIQEVVFFNVYGLSQWQLMSPWCFGYIEDGKIFVLGHKMWQWSREGHGITISVADAGPMCLVRYSLPIKSFSIDGINLNGSIVIDTPFSVYYAHSYDMFRFKNIEKSPLNQSSLIATKYENKMVNYRLVTDISTQNRVTTQKLDPVNVRRGDRNWERLQIIAEMLPSSMEFTAKCQYTVDYSVSTPQTKVSFIFEALREFAETYLVRYGGMTDFNFKAIKKCTEVELKSIGRALGFALRSLDYVKFLPIRLPLPLLESMRNELSSSLELEYFVARQRPDKLIEIKKLGYASNDYQDALLHLVICNDYTKKKMQRIGHIGDGFLEAYKIPNVETINLATLDYCISGPYGIDPEQIIRQINFQTTSRVALEKYQDSISKIIRGMTQEQLVNLLNNWSRCAAIDPLEKYNMRICEYTTSFDVFFNPTHKCVIISQQLFDTQDMELITCRLSTQDSDDIYSSDKGVSRH